MNRARIHRRPHKRLTAAGLAMLAALAVSACAERDTDDPAAGEITAEEFAAHVRTLASDEFGGRAPGSEGEARTVAYLEKQFRAIGLAPANGDSYRQEVPLVSITAENVSPLTVRGGEDTLELRYGEDMMVWTKRVVEGVGLEDSELVFVGYGIVAPEYEWDDYRGLDVAGKTVVILVNDPGFATQDETLFNGNAMTYYGRWTYKYEEAARQGAAAALIVHETEAAGYPWLVVSGSWSGEQFDLVTADGNMGRVEVEGWLSEAAATRLLAAAGQDYAALRARAAQRDFEALPLGLEAAVSFDNTLSKSDSYNVAGVLRGRERPEETVIYGAHWDHLGVARSMLEDRIYNGATDNASGIAALLEIAQAFAALEPAPARSVVFLAFTAEESGLLGSAWYVSHPLFPLAETVANINMDAMTLLGPTEDVTVIGYGNSELERYLERAAAAQGRRLEPEPTPEKGFFYRSDHFNFAKRGVPALYAKGGVVHRERGRDYGLAWNRDYVENRYHKVSDEYDPQWDLRGVVEDVQMLYRVGRELAQGEDWPNWHARNEFRAARDASAAARD